jgi:hypothetical protein
VIIQTPILTEGAFKEPERVAPPILAVLPQLTLNVGTRSLETKCCSNFLGNNGITVYSQSCLAPRVPNYLLSQEAPYSTSASGR